MTQPELASAELELGNRIVKTCKAFQTQFDATDAEMALLFTAAIVDIIEAGGKLLREKQEGDKQVV